jgi:alcohol/geraniol dehydrogenase (NADP+)
MKIHAFAAIGPRQLLQSFSYDAPPLAPFEILIKVTHCGLCHSDIHLIDDDWKRSIYPLVPGHEIVGTVLKKGESVKNLNLGNRVGVSWVRSSCLDCPSCLDGETNICPQKTATCNGSHGGFADHMIADSRFSFLIPDALDSAYAAPLLCAGATVYAPLRREVKSPQSVAVIGIGGLGHLALQFAAAFECEVTAISRTASKEAEAKSFGAHHFTTLDKAKAGQFDLILSTVQGNLNWNHVISLLKPKGTLCFVGRPLNPAQIEIGNLISFQKRIVGSSTANRAQMNEMLQFAARHKIKPQIELFPLAEVNRAIEKVKANEARYRVVLEID